jgi:serine/threonine-protein kinase
MADHLCQRCGASNRDTARFCADCGAPLLVGAPEAGASAPAKATASPGTILQSRYQIERELGRGGFGAVYKATDLNLHRPCAVKENFDTSQEAQRQFLREATVLANLSHPNLPRVTDHFQIPNQGQYLVMDFVEGQDLATLVEGRAGAATMEQIITWITQVGEALVYLHGQPQPVLHRDIKPSNIRITPQGKAMLVDFGLVKFYSPHLKTTVGARAITPGYAPPEQYGKGSTDARTDIYALGATLYAALSGLEPPESVQRLAGERLPSASEFNPQVTPALDRVVERAMALEPGQRYQSAREFVAALKTAASAAPSGATKAAPVAATVVVADPPRQAGAAQAGVQAPPYSGVPPADRRSSRPVSAPVNSRQTGLIIVIIVVVVLCFGGSLLVGGLIWTGQQVAAEQTKTAEYDEIQRALALARTQTASVQAERDAATATAKAETLALTATAGAPLTSTAAVEATIRSQQEATQTEQAAQTATVQAVVDAEAREWAQFAETLGVSRTRTMVFGPEEGSLEHEDNTLVKVFYARIDVADFVVEVVFDNPYSTQVGDFDFGFLFRYADAYNNLRVSINSKGTWNYQNLVGDKDNYDFDALAEGTVTNLDSSPTGSNKMTLICQDTRGWLYLNDQLVTTLDLSIRRNAGAVAIGVGMFRGYKVPGNVTNYHNFKIWSLP